jgi:hypothetical protein
MNIRQVVRTYAQQAQLPPARSVITSRHITAASRANQARVTDGAKAFVQAAQIRDGISIVSDAVDRARAVVKKARDTTPNQDEREALQKDLAKAFADLDSGAKAQTASVSDQSLSNRGFDAKHARTTDADHLGLGVSSTFTSASKIRNLDFATASDTDLDEAIRVLDTAKSENKAQFTTISNKVNALSGLLDVLEDVQDTLEGTKRTEEHKRDIASLRSLIQRNQALVPGSIFSSLA